MASCGIAADDTFHIGIAVSGGPDSLALLLLMHAFFAGNFAAATVDHQLRHNSAAEACFVSEICASLGINHSILHPARPILRNIQSSARSARYDLLAHWADQSGCSHIATAHHADDQLETVLMRLARGSGVDGMSGIRAVNGRIVRPLLNFQKAELIGICAAANVSPITDPSNQDRDFDRVRMRQWLASLPNPLSPAAAVRSAAALADAGAALEWSIQQLIPERISEHVAEISLNPSGLPREYQRRLLLFVLAMFEPETRFKGEAIVRALTALHAGQKMTLGNIACTGGETWQFSAAPRRSGAKS